MLQNLITREMSDESLRNLGSFVKVVAFITLKLMKVDSLIWENIQFSTVRIGP